MPRFYCPCPLAIGAAVTLPDAVAHHIQVLRLAPDAIVTLFNNAGGEFLACLSLIEKKRVVAQVTAFSPREAELPYALTLAQALPEGSKMEWIVEKAVELGAARIEPLAAQRCVVRLNAERAAKKAAHWQSIIEAASEQCGRNRLAQLEPLAEIKEWLARGDNQPRLLLSPRGTSTLPDWARQNAPQAVTIMIGPEGGFSEAEEDAAVAGGAILLTMGPRVLRTETAGVAALGMLGAIWGLH